jgi:GxxExxY protein
MSIEFDKLSQRVIGCAIEVHRPLGPGLLESAYETCLAHELDTAKIEYVRQYPLPIVYKGAELDCGYRLDFLVGDSVVVELKAVDKLLPVHQAQVLTYLKLARKHIGLLINFNVHLLKDGVKRVVL